MPIRSHYRNKNLIWLSECPITNGKSLTACHNKGDAQNGTFNGERLFVFHGGLVFLFDQNPQSLWQPLCTGPGFWVFPQDWCWKCFPAVPFLFFLVHFHQSPAVFPLNMRWLCEWEGSWDELQPRCRALIQAVADWGRRSGRGVMWTQRCTGGLMKSSRAHSSHKRMHCWAEG